MIQHEPPLQASSSPLPGIRLRSIPSCTEVVMYIFRYYENKFGTLVLYRVVFVVKMSLLFKLKQLNLSLWGQYLVIKSTEQNMKLLSIKSIYFSQELSTDIALYGVTITLSRDKASFPGNSLDKETSALEILYKNMRNIEDTKILYKIPTLNVNNLQRNVYLKK